MDYQSLIFYLIALFVLVMGLLTVLSRNLVHSALYMIATFLGVAAVYVLLQADYLAIVQVLVYVGAIAIILVFGIMLTRRENMSKSNLFSRNAVPAAVILLILLVVISRLILLTRFVTSGVPAAVEPTINQISDLFLGSYAIAFEISGLLLLMAMIGAIIIARTFRSSK